MPPSNPRSGLIHLAIVYTVWGSTYLAIRMAVREGSGFPPFTMGFTRILATAGFLFALAAMRGASLRMTRADAKVLVVSGLLFWVGGNGLLTWAECRADSGYAALVVGSAPFWAGLCEALLDRRLPSSRFVLSLVTGFAGLGLITWPKLQHHEGEVLDGLTLAALFGCTICWAIGSIWQRRNPVKMDLVASAAWQMLAGSAGYACVVAVAREGVPHPSTEAWLAWGYLVIFGGISFTSFIFALQLLPIRIVMTYAYVNPVIAVFLGWLVINEPLTGYTAAGAALVLVGVRGVFGVRGKE